MKEWLAMAGLGTGLFVTALIGTLAVQGRLDYAGTRGVPIASWLFAPPSADEATAEVAIPADPPAVAASDPTAAPPPTPDEEPAAGAAAATGEATSDQQDADRLEPRSPGLFRFPQIDSGLTAEDVDQALRAAHAARDQAALERVRLAALAADLDLQRSDLQDRESAIARQMLRVEQERDRVEQRIAEFERQVLLVERDDLRGYQEFGRTLAAFDPLRAAAIVMDEWADDVGRQRIVKVLATMDPVDADGILAAVDASQVRALLVERLKVVREPR